MQLVGGSALACLILLFVRSDAAPNESHGSRRRRARSRAPEPVARDEASTLPQQQRASTGSALDLYSRWSQPPWSRQPNGTICSPMSLEAFLRLQALFAEVSALLATLGVQWLLSHGSLLGAWVHHGPVPWDEEGDIVLLPDDFARLRTFLGPPPDAVLKTANEGRMWLYDGPQIGALQYAYHEHIEEGGGWLATAVTFRHASEPRDSSVHVDAFLARTNGTHAWTDSAIMPLEVLLPPRAIRFYDWLAPAPFDPKAALHIWYGPQFLARRKCALRHDSGDDAGVEQIAEVSGKQVSVSYPLVKNEWIDVDVLRSFVHHNGTLLWTLDLDTRRGQFLEVSGLAQSPRLEPLVRAVDAQRSTSLSSTVEAADFVQHGVFPQSIPNMWD